MEIADKVLDGIHDRLGKVENRLTGIETILPFLATKAELHEGFGLLRAEIHSGFATLRAEMNSQTKWLIVTMVSTMLGVAGLLIAAAKLLK